MNAPRKLAANMADCVGVTSMVDRDEVIE